jgi:CBS domain-containing protein
MGMVRELIESLQTRDVVTIGPDATVFDAAKKMNEHRIGALVVTRDGRHVDGILTERDVLQRVVAAGRAPMDARIEEVMTAEVIVCRAETRCDDVRQTMRTRRIRHMPVVDADGVLVGIVSIGDLNTAEVKDLSDTVGYLSEYMTRM